MVCCHLCAATVTYKMLALCRHMYVTSFSALQGAGKTTTCTKYGAFYKKKGFKPALVCADTFRAGAQLQTKRGNPADCITANHVALCVVHCLLFLQQEAHLMNSVAPAHFSEGAHMQHCLWIAGSQVQSGP